MENLKLNICPRCAKKSTTITLGAVPTRQCNDCKIEWGYEIGIRPMYGYKFENGKSK